MKSLNNLYAEFARTEGSKDKTQRKRKGTLAGSVGTGALVGGGVGAALGGGAAYHAGLKIADAAGIGGVSKHILATGAALAAIPGAAIHTAVLGGVAGAGAYGVNKGVGAIRDRVGGNRNRSTGGLLAKKRMKAKMRMR